MLARFTEWILHHRLLVGFGAAALAALGVHAWRELPMDAFPDVTNVQVMVLTEAPGLAPVDVEQQITFPLELAVQGLPDVRQVRSLSRAELSQVVVVFADRVDTYFARQLVFERLQAAREDLPAWAEPKMGPVSTGLGEIYQYTLESASRGPMELRTIQDWLVAPRLRGLSGVNEVNSFGGLVKQFHVVVEPHRLLQYGVTLPEVLDALENNNANAGGSFIVNGWEQTYVRSLGLIETVADLESIVLKAEDGTPVVLKDVAEVNIGPETRQGAVTRDGKGEAVAGMVIMLKGANSKAVVEEVRKILPAIEASLPGDVRIDTFYDRTALIQACIRTVAGALTQGVVLVILVLFLFLGSLRASLIVALSLPLTALGTFLLMKGAGVTANLMSLGGLAIAMGMIVDASIVITENIGRHLQAKEGSGLSRVRIAGEAVGEVARPVLFAILIIVIVFLPLLTLEQMEGKMFRPLALTLCFAMLASLLVSFTVVPVLGSSFLRGSTAAGENVLVRGLKRGYLRALSVALRRRRTTLAAAAGILAASLLLLPHLGTEFLPTLNEGALAINVVRLPSASLEGSVAVGTEIERRLLAAFPEVKTVVTKTGRAEVSEDPMGPEQSDLIILLHPRKEWTTGRDEAALVEAMQENLGEIPGLRLSFSQPIALRVNELVSGIKSDLAVKVFGPDLEVLQESAQRVAGVLGGLAGAEDVKVEQITGFAQLEVAADRRAMARHKINVSDINETVETAVGGKIATTVVEGQKRFAVRVRFPEAQRRDAAAIARILVPSPEGRHVPLGELAEIRHVEAPAQISRENGMRRVVVECNIRGRDMGSFVAEAREKLRPIQEDLPPGSFVEYGGQFENQQRAMRRLSVVVPLSILLIFLMLFAAFDSLPPSLLVLANLPFALVGGIVILFLLKIHLSVASVIGFIALFGIAVENGTVLVTFFQQLRRQGMSAQEAVRHGCALRFRPLLMTALTTLLGVAPLLAATGSGSEIQRPLAAVVLGGLVTSLLLTLFILPVLYSYLGNGKKAPVVSRPED